LLTTAGGTENGGQLRLGVFGDNGWLTDKWVTVYSSSW